VATVTGMAFRAWKARYKFPHKDDSKLKKRKLEYRRL
jgi:hypothetical protein